MNRKGFSLVELSVVLVVVGILLYGATGLYTVSTQAAKITTNNNILDAIERALSIYYQTHGDMPCPADGTLALTNANFGLGSESPEGTCSYDNFSLAGAAGGVVPTRTLNLPDSYMFDAWGNRISYFVSDACVNNANWTDGIDGSGTDCVDAANLVVRDNTDADLRTSVAAYVIISHGKNGVGSWRRNGGATRVPSTASTSTHEAENAHVNTSGANNSPNAVFRDDFVNDGTVAANYFDDFVRWKVEAQISYEE